VERYGLLQDYNKWKLCERAAGDPLKWSESWWVNGIANTVATPKFSSAMSFGASSTQNSLINFIRVGWVGHEAQGLKQQSRRESRSSDLIVLARAVL
jgi:hypothetical protein